MSASVLIQLHMSILRYRSVASLMMLWSCEQFLKKFTQKFQIGF